MPNSPDSTALGAALLASAWISSRIAAGLGLATWGVGVGLGCAGRARAGGAAGAAATTATAEAAPRTRLLLLAQAIALVAGGALAALTRGEAERWLPPAPQALVAALAAVLGPLGGALGAWGARTLGRAPAGALCTSGPYGLVRHPLYLSLVLCAGSAGLALGSLSGTAVLCAGLLIASHARARLEERALALAHPREFADYAARVRALTPRF